MSNSTSVTGIPVTGLPECEALVREAWQLASRLTNEHFFLYFDSEFESTNTMMAEYRKLNDALGFCVERLKILQRLEGVPE